MRLENSPLAEAMKTGKRGTGLLQDLSLPRTGFSDEPDASSEGVVHGTMADDHYHAGDIDTDQNVEYKGLDDTLRPSIDRDSSSIMRQQRKEETFTSYRDLQKRNRDEYSQKMAVIQRPPVREQTQYPKAPAPPPASSDAYSSIDVKADESAKTAPVPSRPQQQPTKYVRRNQYGDIIED
ncbi:hypothetical protein NP493_251g00000 [Ridgeia piscesae]|uniref:Uncharacterized protein n=1 Tax=Ridgeia piscesae TaxID=27915 RepID=A0AAD9UCZ8_RIDPI|nr:hypothetical protein NP493_251g00000 [Ridgeia piscesae]